MVWCDGGGLVATIFLRRPSRVRGERCSRSCGGRRLAWLLCCALGGHVCWACWLCAVLACGVVAVGAMVGMMVWNGENGEERCGVRWENSGWLCWRCSEQFAAMGEEGVPGEGGERVAVPALRGIGMAVVVVGGVGFGAWVWKGAVGCVLVAGVLMRARCLFRSKSARS